MIYDDSMDKEVINLCDAINSVDKSIRTIESCAGHGKQSLRIWFKATNLKKLPQLLYWFDGCHTGEYGWVVSVHTDCSASYPTFLIDSRSEGKEAYESADHIARCIKAKGYVE